ncbi:autotransporter outer membrane beta-barrel domain-containing protein [Marinobacterium rhizophilum]|uniref:autotransporter outer membrane beta-barrel domain-containing protein n=1 Tax=Marinobacterium rhizophilum TaxID=420402 RepID=UPI000372316E|nr:autotransporter outer membrane beta-barrel domain-containing protein [Marinobacterium rhizophilum]
MDSRISTLARGPAIRFKAGAALGLCFLAINGSAVAQTPAEELDQSWFDICEGAPEGSDLDSKCELLVRAGGPGSGGRRSAAAVGNNLGITSAQSRASATGARIQATNIESRLEEEDDEENGAGASAEMNFGRLSLFVNANYTDTERDQSDFETGFDQDLYGATFGADYRYSDQVTAGLALGYSNSDTDFDANAGELDTDSLSLIAYGNFRPGADLYIDAYLGYASLDYKSTRNISYELVSDDVLLGTVSEVANGKTDGDQWFGGINLGYDRAYGQWTLSPKASIDFIETDIDGYAESGGGGLAQSYRDQSISSLTTNIGVQVSYALSRSWGVLLPQAQVHYIHEFDDDARTLTSSFVDDANATSLSYSTDNPDRNYFTAGIGATAVLANGVMPFIDYQSLLGHDFLDEQVITIGVRIEL